MTKVKYFYDLLSQPARAMWITLKLSKSSIEECPVALRKLEQFSDEYKKVNRFQKVPCIVDGDFHLAESVAILRYLADKGQVKEQFYPKDLQQRARVDEFLEWQHFNLRAPCSTYFVKCYLMPAVGMSEKPKAEVTASLVKDVEKHLSLVENIWLNKSQFLTGSNLCAADIFGACEIHQIKTCQYNVGAKFPKIAEWLEQVREQTNPAYDEGHKFINKMAAAKL